MKSNTFKLIVVIPILLLTSFKGLSQDSEIKQEVQPNILFVAVDNLRPKLNYYGANHIQSPNLDKLAGESLIFERAYCNVPVCGVSRASLMTGTRPTRHRFIDAHIKKEEDYPEAISLPLLLKKNSYQTISNGKIYHYGNDDSDAWDEIWHTRTLWSYALLESQEIRKNKRRSLPIEIADVHDSIYRDGELALKVIKDLQKLKDSNKPFFLTMRLAKPHLPFAAPKKYLDLYDRNQIELPESYVQPETTTKQDFHDFGELRQNENIPKKGDLPEGLAKKLIHGYYASVSYIDAQIGLVLDKLKRLNLDDDTIVILWGDHGWNLGDHKLWCKHINFETVIKTPLIIKGPGKTAGQKTDAITEYIDIYPSLAELEGLKSPSSVEGKSFVPVINGQKSDKNWAVSKFKEGVTLIKDQLFYTEWVDDAGFFNARMLFDHKTDSLERDNLAEKLYIKTM